MAIDLKLVGAFLAGQLLVIVLLRSGGAGTSSATARSHSSVAGHQLQCDLSGVSNAELERELSEASFSTEQIGKIAGVLLKLKMVTPTTGSEGAAARVCPQCPACAAGTAACPSCPATALAACPELDVETQGVRADCSRCACSLPAVAHRRVLPGDRSTLSAAKRCTAGAKTSS
jgi:hypothetical protein